MATTLITSRYQPIVGSTLCLIETGWHYVGICRACWTNNWQWRWADEQTDIEPTTFFNVSPTILPTKCQRWPNKLLNSTELALITVDIFVLLLTFELHRSIHLTLFWPPTFNSSIFSRIFFTLDSDSSYSFIPASPRSDQRLDRAMS